MESIQRLYDANRFLEAYRQTAAFWTPGADVSALSADELILGARLAYRLGGGRLWRWLMRRALAKDPASTRVRYFTRHIQVRGQRRRTLLDQLREYEGETDFGGADHEIRASWFASQAWSWGSLRDFPRAFACLEHAHAAHPDDSWVYSCQADVLEMADRRAEALQFAERSCELNPGAPFALGSLGLILLKLGRIEEAARRLAAAAEAGESYEVAMSASWYQCALAEVQEGGPRRATVGRARELMDAAVARAPLADRDTRAEFARRRLDIAEMADDHAEMERWAGQARSPFHRTMLANLRKNPGGARLRLPYRREIQKYDACFPASLAAALAVFGVHLEPDAMAADITFGGTAGWAAAEWLEKRGLEARFFTVTPESAARLIRNGIAFVACWDSDDFAHAMAVVGIDEAAGTLLIHDPNYFRTSEYLLDGMSRGQAPMGPRGLAVAPRDQAPLLDGLLPEDAAVAAAFERQQKAFVLGGPSAGRPIAAEIRQQFPQHPGARLMSAMQAEEDGRTGEALAGYQELSNEIPDSASVRRRLLSACRALGNAALMRKTLRDVVERGVLPGVRSQQEWDYPPDRHVCHYADLLRFSAETRQQAAALLHGVLKRNGNCGEAWHNLGDLLWDERDFPDALLAYRLGSLNAVDNEHYARAYCDALAGQSRENEGLAWLEQRVRESGASQRAVAVWPTWIGALEDYGHPERALAACQEALERHGHAAELLGFAVPFLARMGHWERAEDTLRRLEACGNAAVFHESATYFHSMRGDLEDAVRHAEAAVREQPGAMPARKTLLELRSRRDGAPAAVQEAARWSAEQPGHDELEEIYYFQLEWGSATAKKYEVLRRRVKRDPEDGWAWAALAYACAYYYQFAGERRQRRIEKRIAPFLAECDRTAPDDSATRRVYAQWLEARCEWPAAVAAWLRAVERDPGDAYRYRRTWDCAASLDGARRLEVWERLEAMMLRRPGRLALAPDMAPLLAQRFGVDFAEQAVSRWLAARPEDPEVRLAAANLLLDYGHGRSDAARALEMLKPAVEHFPYHFDLRLALARAHRALRQHAEAEEVLGEALRRHPANSTALIQMIWVHERGGKKEDADRLLALAMARDPYNADVWNARAEVLLERGRHEDVRAVVAEGLRRSPESVYWRERSMNLLIQCGDSDEAVRVAREGVRVHPRGAYLWLLLGRTLSRWRRHAAPGEIERCLRRGLELNRSLFDAADWLACLLVEQSRYDDAAQVMREILPRLDDPCTARGRLAWIARQQGRKTEAIDEMAAVLQAAPWYSWGWSRLIEWIEEDKEWERARSLLGELPGPMRTVLSFRVQRLKALDKAGRDAAAVDAEWNELLRDFPGDESLRLDRYDLLREAKREAEAAEALDAIVREFPESPFVQARWAAALFAQGRHEPALEAALRVWFAPVEESTWPVDKVWAAAHEAERHKELYARARARLERGEQPTARAWVTMASHAATIADPWWWRFFAHASYLARETTALLRMLDRAAWDGRAGRAALLAQMNEDRRYATLVRYWKKRRAVVEADTPCWVEVGRALLALGRRRAARKLLASWPARPGVMMWMVANYVLTLPRTPRGFRDARAACRGALAALPHDHCARCLAYILAESCAALGDTTGLLETWNTYRAYFQRATEKGEWFDPKRANLHHDVPALVGFLEEKKRWRYRAKVLRIWVGDLRQG